LPGLEDLGKGFTTSMEDKIRSSNLKRRAQETLRGQGGSPIGTSRKELDEEGKESVTAPGQPKGPIVGVVSLWDLASFKRYHEHENYTEWTFSIFDLLSSSNNRPIRRRAERRPPRFRRRSVAVRPHGRTKRWRLELLWSSVPTRLQMRVVNQGK
jgi:hypothetical protein